ncbi:uncharacterized protein N0V89_008457 [Didymosphaeria variabile]|uniref:Uncharacterized protein n=1 Tax=Didymosphaeria variabile TaxID=1932322 RepID=A0A9W9C8U8_9PLEO|nr:uncharacterized protein N0V89_008457 [Didymosphaeria variabile]KAJ4349838.1 hypothetical protein N0V89_008457 [Didymosphaeria variabile]
MADNNIPAELDLEQILATLASLPQTTSHPVPPQQQFPTPDQVQGQTDSPPASHSLAQTGISHGYVQAQDPRLTTRPPAALANHQPLHRSQTSTLVIDPATITEWKHGLRCVNKIATQNLTFVPAIQKLMAEQARNVKDWESGRQRLIDEQAIKRENEKTHLAVLSLPGMGEKIAPLRTDVVEKEELEQYGKKVYRACQRMVESHSAVLKGLGVPFFGLRPEFLRAEGSEEGDDGEEKKKVTKEELLELQRKMLNHLMELYGD